MVLKGLKKNMQAANLNKILLTSKQRIKWDKGGGGGSFYVSCLNHPVNGSVNGGETHPVESIFQITTEE